MITGLIVSLLLGGADFQKQLDLAGSNRLEIELAIHEVPDSQKAGMAWLLTHMPEEDLKILSGEFLLTNCNLAYEAWKNAPWADQITEEIFFDTILPYANVNERRDNWRGDFHDKFIELVSEAKTPTEATILLNKNIFDLVDVSYSTERPKADQSPFESIEAGMASCSGLSILLVDACRSVGVPARFAGTPLWYNESGNHSWVEFWDDGWHYTGGAEPTGDKVDVSWFDDSASKATKGHSLHAIFAVTWNTSDKHFPLVWLPDVKTYGAIDVTDRYTKSKVSELVPIRFRATNKEGTRVPVYVELKNAAGELLYEGITNKESADANDHLTFFLPKGDAIKVHTSNSESEITVDAESIIELEADKLSKQGALRFASQVWQQRAKAIKDDRASEMESMEISYQDKIMPIWFTTYGNAPFGEKSLWISMHGGGGAPAEVNTSQWENQKKLYTLEEGVYLAPRAPTDTWNLWHQSHIDPMFERLIENMIVFEGVDPNRVYIIGYSAGGDGVYQLAPRMADKLAAAGMMAGHPNETVPDGLLNIGFALHVGGKDSAYDRNMIAAQWKDKLETLQKTDPSGYANQVVIHASKGHWMDFEEAKMLPWLGSFERNPYPSKIVWVQDDVLHEQFYWLSVEEPKERTKIVVSVDGQTITFLESDVQQITMYLNDEMLDVDKPVVVKYKEKVIGTFDVTRQRIVIQDTLRDAGDFYTASIKVNLPL